MAKRHLAPLPTSAEAGGEGRERGGGYGGYGSYRGVGEAERNGNEVEEEMEWGWLPPIGGVMIGREAYQRVWILSTVDTGYLPITSHLSPLYSLLSPLSSLLSPLSSLLTPHSSALSPQPSALNCQPSTLENLEPEL
jgi:hypothetical protein